jgi:hypothetical protein
MPLPVRLILAFMLSLVAAGMVQQAAMINDRANGPLGALPPLAVCVLLVTLMFGLVAWWRPSALTRTAAVLLIVMLVFGVAVYIMGVNSYAPGLGGNINYLIAMLVDFYFLLPSAVAVAVHWRVLNSTASGAAVKPQG